MGQSQPREGGSTSNLTGVSVRDGGMHAAGGVVTIGATFREQVRQRDIERRAAPPSADGRSGAVVWAYPYYPYDGTTWPRGLSRRR
jgi:hypothetical protein